MTHLTQNAITNPTYRDPTAASAQRAPPSRGTSGAPKGAPKAPPSSDNANDPPANPNPENVLLTPIRDVGQEIKALTQRQSSLESAFQAAGIQTPDDGASVVSGASALSDLTSHMGGSAADPFGTN